MQPYLAVVLGASGSVGQPLIDALNNASECTRIIAIVRRPLASSQSPKLEQVIVDPMTPSQLQHTLAGLLEKTSGPIVGFSVLGVGAGTAKMTIDEHRAVDVDLNAAFARGLKASANVNHLVFMSAVGANIRASASGSGAAGMSRYARVKGEAEQAVMNEGPAVVSIVRPSVILGSKHTPGLLGSLMTLATPVIPSKLKPIKTSEIAWAMVALARNAPQSSATYEYKALKALLR
jgi:uncharacterized protein YbjT (DUF2867 family)